MSKPRIFLGSSGKQAKLLQAITRGLEDIADVEPWTTAFNPGRSTLSTDLSSSPKRSISPRSCSPRTTGRRRMRPSPVRRRRATTWSSRPGCSAARSASAARSSSTRTARSCRATCSGSPRSATTRPPARRRFARSTRSSARRSRPRAAGATPRLWWQLSLTTRSEEEPSAVSLLRISRDRDGGLNVERPGLQEDGTVSARYWSEAAKERRIRPACLLLLEASALGTECPAARGHRRDQGGDHRPRHRVLDDPVGSRPRAECPNRRRLPSSRPLRPPGPGRGRRGRRGGSSSSRSASRSGSRPPNLSDRAPLQGCRAERARSRRASARSMNLERLHLPRIAASPAPSAPRNEYQVGVVGPATAQLKSLRVGRRFASQTEDVRHPSPRIQRPSAQKRG